jgi:hypothetical protein
LHPARLRTDTVDSNQRTNQYSFVIKLIGHGLTMSPFNVVSMEPPLIFFRGTYRSLSSAERNPEWPLPTHY